MVKKEKHEVLTGRMIDGRIEKPFWAGDAFYYPERGYFEMCISLFDDPWYISANKDSDTYTVFREKVEEDGEVRFRRPIGKAFIADKFKSYLKICIPLWNPRYQPYLSLYPVS